MNNNKSHRRVAVIGGGAAGMMAAITAAEKGAHVCILERNPKLGKKLAQTGNGRCNYTNLELERSKGIRYFRSEKDTFPWEVLSGFSPDDSIEFFKKLGIYPKYRGSYVYPNSDQAASFVSAMVQRIEYLGIPILYDCKVEKIIKNNKENIDKKGNFRLVTSQGEFCYDAVILAAGSKAFPNTGSDGNGYEIVKALGHHIIPVVPALSALRCAGKQYKEMSGVRVDAELQLFIEKSHVYTERGELQLTDYGISGIPVFQFSRFAAYGLQNGKEVYVRINFLPEFSDSKLKEYLLERRKILFYKTAGGFLEGLLNQKLALVLLKRSGIRPGEAVKDLREDQIVKLSKEIHAYRAEVSSVNPFENAQSAAGGVDVREVNPKNMESSIVSGLFFAGEILDVDGICGGYNLQFAWASGRAAGLGAASLKMEERK